MSDSTTFANITDRGSSIEVTAHGSVQVFDAGEGLQISLWKNTNNRPVYGYATKDTDKSTDMSVLKVRQGHYEPREPVRGNDPEYLSEATLDELNGLTGHFGSLFQVKHVPVKSADGKRDLFDGYNIGNQGDWQENWEIVFETRPGYAKDVRSGIDWTDASTVNPASLQSAGTPSDTEAAGEGTDEEDGELVERELPFRPNGGPE